MPRPKEKNNNRTVQKNKSGSGRSAGQRWFTVHKATTHNDAECYALGAPRSQPSSTHAPVVVGAQTRSDDTENKAVVILTTTSTTGSHFFGENTTGTARSLTRGVTFLHQRGVTGNTFHGIAAHNALGIAGKTIFGIATTL